MAKPTATGRTWDEAMHEWKFATALRLMDDRHPWKGHVASLAALVGDCGWMEGALADIIGLAVEFIKMHAESGGGSPKADTRPKRKAGTR